jgi:hypothetical protein
MVMQKFHDLSVEFDTSEIVGKMSWEQFLGYCKDDNSTAHVVRLRFIGDYVGKNHLILDFSYAYVRVNGDIYDITFFPITNWHGVNRGAFRTDLYKMVKTSGVFVPNLFSSLSIFV